MRFIERDGGMTQLFLSTEDTRHWKKSWPLSYLAGKRLFAEWDSDGNLTELKINGEDDANVKLDELNALFAENLPEDHPSQR